MIGVVFAALMAAETPTVTCGRPVVRDRLHPWEAGISQWSGWCRPRWATRSGRLREAVDQ